MEETKDPKHHVGRINEMLGEVIDHIREDIRRVDDPRALALFETSAEVLSGLKTAYEHYEEGSEKAWR